MKIMSPIGGAHIKPSHSYHPYQKFLIQQHTPSAPFSEFTPYNNSTIEIAIMEGPNNNDLEAALQDFRQLNSKTAIPAKMQKKLLFLETCIVGLRRQEGLLQDLPEFQRLSLEQMNRETQISLFVSIVKCLAGKEAIQYFNNERATLRREKSFAGWTSCFITCDTNNLSVIKKREDKEPWHQFAIERLWVSKVYRPHKKRFIFGIAYDRNKYQLGFDEEGTCARIHGIVIDLIRQRRQLREKLKEVNTTISNHSQLATELEFQKEDGVFEKDFDEEEYMEFQQREYLSNLQTSVLKQQLFDNTGYELVKNIEKGRILEKKGQSSFKICILMEKMTITTILQKFIEFTQWNSQVQSFRIVRRMRSNTYLAFLKLKKYNMLTYPRETYLTITQVRTCSCLASEEQRNQTVQPELGKHYLLLNTLQSQPVSSGSVQMNLQQVLELSSMEDTPDTVFMILWSKIDFKGYDYFTSNREMNLHFLSDFAHLTTYCRQKNLAQPKGSTFDLDYCACRLKKQRKNSCQSDVSVISIKEEQQKKQPVQASPFKKINVLSAIEKYHKGIRDDDLIDVMRKRLFQSYYFTHRFSQAMQNGNKIQQEKDYLLQGGRWKLNNGNLVFCDEQAIKAQKGILKMILKQMGSNLMAGKSIMNMSLPVQIFDTTSMLEVLANMMGFFPRFINQAVNAVDPVEQMKYVTMSYVFMTSCFPNALKPFNPILGETFQGILGGIPIYMEQTSHHPPISSLFMRTDDFQTYGNFDVHIDLGLNSAHSKISSYFTVKFFKSKREYVIRLADVEMGGISFGERTMRLDGRGFVYEKINDVYCEFSIGKEKKKVYQYSHRIKTNDLAGGIFKVTNAFGKKLMIMDKSKAFEGVKPDDIIQKYCHISGAWYGDVFFDNVPYKTLEKGPFPVHVQRPLYLLPSDSMFRTDIIYKKWGQNAKSNEQKEVLQNLQRKDRKLRQKNKSH